MSQSWYLMSNSNQLSGFESDEIQKHYDVFDEILLESPESYDVTINNTPKKAIIQSTTKDDERTILSKIDEIKTGDIVNHKSNDWLIFTHTDDNRVYEKGKMRLCNSTLKWQDDEGNIQEYPCIIFRPTGSGTDTDKYMTLPDKQYYVMVQSNIDTNKLKRDNRFIFFDNAWNTIFIDRSKDGLLTLTIKEGNVSEGDDVSNRIADYIDHTYTVTINNKPTELNTGDTLQLDVTAYMDGTEVSSPSLTFTSSDDTVATVDSGGLVEAVAEGTVTITVDYQDTSDSFTVDVVTVASNNHSANIIGANEIIIQDTESYTVEWLNNGSVISDTIDTITIDDTSLASVTKTGNNSFDIVANNDYGTITVTVASVTNGISASKTIEITSLW